MASPTLEGTAPPGSDEDDAVRDEVPTMSQDPPSGGRRNKRKNFQPRSIPLSANLMEADVDAEEENGEEADGSLSPIDLSKPLKREEESTETSKEDDSRDIFFQAALKRQNEEKDTAVEYARNTMEEILSMYGLGKEQLKLATSMSGGSQYKGNALHPGEWTSCCHHKTKNILG